MSNRSQLLAAMGALALTLLGWSVMAHAQTATETDAQRTFEAGVALANRGRWADAESAFVRSSHAKPVAATWINLAAVRVRLGRVTHALEALEHLSALPPQNVTDRQRERAAEVRREALALAAKRTLRVTPPHSDLRIDGLVVKSSGAERVLLLDPGRHVLTLHAPDFRSRELFVDAEAGSEATIEVSLSKLSAEPQRAPSASQAADPLRPLPPVRKDAGKESSSIWASPWLWTGVGATITAAVVLAVLAPWSQEAAPHGGNTGIVETPPR
jgi:hypothetical protein